MRCLSCVMNSTVPSNCVQAPAPKMSALAMSKWLVGSSRHNRGRRRHEHLRQRKTALLAAGEHAHALVDRRRPLKRNAPSSVRTWLIQSSPAPRGRFPRTRCFPRSALQVDAVRSRFSTRAMPYLIVPASGSSTPAIIFRSVDLPAPFGPDERHLLAAVQREIRSPS